MTFLNKQLLKFFEIITVITIIYVIYYCIVDLFELTTRRNERIQIVGNRAKLTLTKNSSLLKDSKNSTLFAMMERGGFGYFMKDKFTQVDANLSDNLQLYSVYADYRSLNIYKIEYKKFLESRLDLQPLSVIGIGTGRDNTGVNYQIVCKFWFIPLNLQQVSENCTTLACVSHISNYSEAQLWSLLRSENISLKTKIILGALQRSWHNTEASER